MGWPGGWFPRSSDKARYRYLGTQVIDLGPATLGAASVFRTVTLSPGTFFRVSWCSFRGDATGTITVALVAVHDATGLIIHTIGAPIAGSAGVDLMVTWAVGQGALNANITEPGGTTLTVASRAAADSVFPTGSSATRVGLAVTGTNAADAIAGAQMAVEYYARE